MDQFGLENVRNVVLLSHNGSGKTSLAEAALFNCGVINRIGRVEDGTTVSDYDPGEVKRRMSINLSLLPCTYSGVKINIIDTPGYPDFVADVKAGIRVAEGAIILVEAAASVEVGTELTWAYCEENHLPRLLFVNKMDRENADFTKVLKDVQTKFGTRCVAIQVPIGSQADFKGVIDLFSMKAYMGTDAKEGEIPANLKAQVDSLKEKLIEAIAEVDDTLLEKYLAGETIASDKLMAAFKTGIDSGKVVPVLAGAGMKNIGVKQLFDAVNAYLPLPKDRKVTMISGDKEELVVPSNDAPLAALVFKTTADPYVGKLTYFRVYSGVLDSNSQVFNSTKGENERIGQLFVVRGKNTEAVPQIRAGDIGGVAKLNVTATGDTLCSAAKPVKLPPLLFPDPLIEKAVYPKTKTDLDKMGSALNRLTEEDVTLRVRRDHETSETVIAGLGETQLEVAAEKIQRKFGVGVNLETPRVAYRETITEATEAEYKHKKQTGGHGQYGHVVLRLEPTGPNTGTQFVDEVVGGRVPKNFIPAVEKGVNEAVHEGVLAGYPVADVKIAVFDGSFHPVDSSEICFKIAGAGAVRKGLESGKPILLEPIMDMTVTIPESYTGDIIGDLNTKRAQVQGMNPGGGMNVIQAQVPLAEVQRYAIDLKSITQGRGTFKMEFSHYQQVPQLAANKVIQAREAQKAATTV
jgi:elongation factor G